MTTRTTDENLGVVAKALGLPKYPDEGPPVLSAVPDPAPTLESLIHHVTESDHVDDVDLMIDKTGSRLIYREGSHVTLAMGPDPSTHPDTACGYLDLAPGDALTLARHLIRCARIAGARHEYLPAIDVLLSDTIDAF